MPFPSYDVAKIILLSAAAFYLLLGLACFALYLFLRWANDGRARGLGRGEWWLRLLRRGFFGAGRPRALSVLSDEQILSNLERTYFYSVILCLGGLVFFALAASVIPPR